MADTFILEIAIMVQSMTGFARLSQPSESGQLLWEIRSLNHRYLELSFHLPESLRLLEPQLRMLTKTKITRGKIEVYLKWLPNPQQNTTLATNEPLLETLVAFSQNIANKMNQPSVINPFDFLNYPGVLQNHLKENNQDTDRILELFQHTLTQLLQTRQNEGTVLTNFLHEKLEQIQNYVDQIEKRLPHTIQKFREKLLLRFHELQVQLDEQRLEQEIVLSAQKYDVAEEISRLQAHCQEVIRTLKQDYAVGRRLDFLLQELNREANTLSAKSMDQEMTYLALECKVIIEQMREQVQNIE